ncbi:MAG: EAL domain-containing protein [Xanthomonadaceae bacterium]|nr:EAL domain-containing protein [Xanthomonadaceae bacterium]
MTLPVQIRASWVAVALAALAIVPLALGGAGDRVPIPNFLAWHTLLEAIAVALSLQIALSAWSRSNHQHPLRLLAAGFFGVSLFDLAHLLSYPGMPPWLPGEATAYSEVFWFGARFLGIATLLMVTLHEGWRGGLAALCGIGAALAVGFAWVSLPGHLLAQAMPFTTEGSATDVGIGIAYLLLAVVWGRQVNPALRADLVVPGLVILGVGELVLGARGSGHSLSDAMGHLYKLAGTGLLLRAVVHARIIQPHRELQQEKLARQNAADQIDQLIRAAPDGILVATDEGKILTANPAADRLFAAAPGSLAGREIDELVPTGARERHRKHRKAYHDHAVVRPMSRAQDLRARRLDDSQFFVDVSLSPLEWNGQHVVVAFVRDSTTRVEQMLRLDWLATHDELTGLPNRWALIRELGRRLASGEGGVCLEFDIDNLGRINDALGHDTGDELLRTFAARLQSATHADEYLSRSAGDRFVLLLPTRPDTAGRIEVLAASVNRPLDLSFELRVDVTATGGSCRFPQDARTPESILQAVDVATTTAKLARYQGVTPFDPSQRQRGSNWINIASRMNGALDDGQFRLVYQPKVGLTDRSGQGFEVLLRWRTPHGDISPAEFIPVAEESGFIVALGRWTLVRAIAKAAEWRAAGLDPGRIAINLSARQLGDAGLPEFIAGQLLTHGLQARDFELEITESVAMENLDWALPRVQALASLGLHITLDDFGTGYSSLAYLQKLPVAILKIDLRFVQAIGDADGEVLLRTIIGLAHGLGKYVVAEGVETTAQESWLRDAGCDQAQGWLHGRPLECVDVPAYLAAAMQRSRLAEPAL